MDYVGSLERRILQEVPSSFQSHWCHTSETAGFDSAVFENKNIRYFRGYFQSYKYLNFVRQSVRTFDISLIKPSPPYLALRSQILPGPYTVVHIRRGDYVTAAPNFGLLDYQYYARGLELLASQGSLGKVLVFSDNPRAPEDKSLSNLFDQFRADFVETSDLDPAEALMLMSGGSNFVLGNSSFSWWAAALSQTENVVYPEPWFHSESQPEDLNPPSWFPVKSSWLD
jgi:hypothetical protein